MYEKTAKIKNKHYFAELDRIISIAGSRKKIAETLGISYSTVSNWCNPHPKFVPSWYNCYQLEKFYGADQKILRGNLQKLYLVG